MGRNGECRNTHAIKSPSGSEKKLLIMGLFMIIASAWSLNVTVEKEKAIWLLPDRGCK